MLNAANLPDDIAALKAILLAKLKRMHFGRKFEKLDQQVEQLEFQLEDLEVKRRSPKHRHRWT